MRERYRSGTTDVGTRLPHLPRTAPLPDILVLAAGGVLGEAWMSGVLAGMEEASGLDFREVETFVGTSAGPSSPRTSRPAGDRGGPVARGPVGTPASSATRRSRPGRRASCAGSRACRDAVRRSRARARRAGRRDRPARRAGGDPRRRAPPRPPAPRGRPQRRALRRAAARLLRRPRVAVAGSCSARRARRTRRSPTRSSPRARSRASSGRSDRGAHVRGRRRLVAHEPRRGARRARQRGPLPAPVVRPAGPARIDPGARPGPR